MVLLICWFACFCRSCEVVCGVSVAMLMIAFSMSSRDVNVDIAPSILALYRARSPAVLGVHPLSEGSVWVLRMIISWSSESTSIVAFTGL